MGKKKRKTLGKRDFLRLKRNLLKMNHKLRDKTARLKCPRDDCDKNFPDQDSLDWHLNRVHKEVVPTICDWENCGKSFKSAQATEEHKKRIHFDKAPHKCTKCEKGFNTFEEIKSHFLLTHTKWKKDESSADNRQTNIPIDKESTSGANDLRSLSFTPNVSENEDSSDDFDFESFFDKPKFTKQKVEIVFECDRNNCGKCFKTSGELESHKTTHDVDNDDKLQKCTKCDARFDSFELVKTHFLHTHTNWKKEEALDEDKESEDVTIVKKSSDCKTIVPKVPKTEDRRAAVKKTNKNYSKNILNTKKTGKLINPVTSESRVEGFASNSNDTILNENQSVSNANNTVDDLKNTYLIYTEEVMVNSENPTFYIVKTKPNVDDSTSNVPDNSLYQLLTKNTASNFTNNITVANCPSSFTQHDMSKAKFASYAPNFISDLRKNRSNVENKMPQIENATSIQSNVIPIVRNITPNLANVIPIVRNITPNLSKFTTFGGNNTPNPANAIPVVRNVTPNLANATAVVRNVTPNLANATTVVGNNTPNLANVTPVVGNNTPNLANDRPVAVNIISDDEIPVVRKHNMSSDVANTKPWVNKSASMLANIIPVIGNIVPKVPAVNTTPNLVTTTRDFGTSTCDLKKSRRTYERRKRQSSNLDDTKPKENGSEIQKCDDFRDNCTRASQFGAHVSKPARDEPYICPFEGGISTKPKENGSEIQKCDGFRDNSTKEPQLHAHVTKPYICPFDCGKRFSRRDDLDRHIHIRIRNKPILFDCHICQKRFITLDFLQKHAKIHEKDLLGPRANSENDNVEIVEEIDLGVYLSSENTDVTNATCPESDTDDDNSEVEDNTNPTAEISDEDYSSEGENIKSYNTEVPGLVEDEVCLDLGENFDNTPIDPLSGISSFEGVPLPKIIKREEETTEPMPRLIDIGEKNMEFIPEQLINTEDFEELIPPQIIGIREDIIERLPSPIIKRLDEDIEIKHIPTLEVMNTEECVESITDQILNIGGNSMEIMPLEEIKKEDENIEPIPEAEQMINSEEGIDLIPAKRIKREEVINKADATLALLNLSENRILQVRLERLPFFI